ncbi:MAG: hypothetical protein ACRETQ_12030 [Gammaproteobacteria bacterium]
MKRILPIGAIVAALAALLMSLPTAASAQAWLSVEVNYAPPPLPWYPQPPCPGPGYLWTPGYWAYGPWGYYWVPGTWVWAPMLGVLWTPGYWAFDAGDWWWQPGYWGPNIGFYGGVDYGYGYPGSGYVGGYWQGGAFWYNRTVTNVEVSYIYNTYRGTAILGQPPAIRVSYNGGAGGIQLQPTRAQWRYARRRHYAWTPWQQRQQRLALVLPAQRFAVNHGRPEVAATSRPGEFPRADAAHVPAGRAGYVVRPVEQGQSIRQPQFQDVRRGQAGNQQPRLPDSTPYAQQVQEQRNFEQAEYPSARLDEPRRLMPARVSIPRPAPAPTYASPFVVRPPALHADGSDAGAHWQPARINQGTWQGSRQPPFRPQVLQRVPSVQGEPRAEPRPAVRKSGSRGSGHPHIRTR